MNTETGLKAGDLLPRPIGVALPSLRREDAPLQRAREHDIIITGDGSRPDEPGPVLALLCSHPAVRTRNDHASASDASVEGVVLRPRACGAPGESALARLDDRVRLLHVMTDGREAVCRDMGRLLRTRPSGSIAKAAAYHLDGIGTPVSAFPPGMVRKLAGLWAREHEFARAACERLGDRALMVHAEALAGDERTLGKVLGFLGVQRDEAVIRTMMGDLRAVSPGDGSGVGWGLTGGAPVGWRRLFTQDDKARFKQAAGTLLIELGFERDLHW